MFNSIADLKRKLLRTWDLLSLEDIRTLIDSFPKRLVALVKCKRGAISNYWSVVCFWFQYNVKLLFFEILLNIEHDFIHYNVTNNIQSVKKYNIEKNSMFE